MRPLNSYKKKKINADDYTNIHTGESLSSEHPNTTSVNIKDEDLQIVNTLEYMIVDSKAFRYIQSIFSKVDMAKIQSLSDMVYGVYNILHDKRGTAHSPQTLRLSLGIDPSEFSRFMKRLHTKSIIHYIDGYKDGRKCKWIMLNPFLSRKGKRFHKDCLCVFDDLSLKGGISR